METVHFMYARSVTGGNWKLQYRTDRPFPFSHLENQIAKQQTMSAKVVAFSARTLYFED